jgi:hypothetical protein
LAWSRGKVKVALISVVVHRGGICRRVFVAVWPAKGFSKHVPFVSVATGRHARPETGIAPEKTIDVCLSEHDDMPMKKLLRATRYTRKSFFVDPKAIRRARRALGVGTDAEAVRLAVERVVEMQEFWRFMEGTRGRLAPGSIGAP